MPTGQLSSEVDNLSLSLSHFHALKIRLTCSLLFFNGSYMASLKELLKRKQENIPQTLSASLNNIYLFR